MSEFLFNDEDDNSNHQETADKNELWKVLIIDDEPDIHQITKLVLANLSVDNKRLEFISAFSGEEAKTILKQHNDIAVAIVDVVMETVNSGLDVVKFIREDLHNHAIRLVLRNGPTR